MQLPVEVRESLIVTLDEYFENENDSPDASELAHFLVQSLEQVAEEAGVDGVEDLIERIEEEAELDEALVRVLQDELSANDELELTGDDVIAFFVDICQIKWDEEEEFDELDEFEDFDVDDESGDLFDEDI